MRMQKNLFTLLCFQLTVQHCFAATRQRGKGKARYIGVDEPLKNISVKTHKLMSKLIKQICKMNADRQLCFSLLLIINASVTLTILFLFLGVVAGGQTGDSMIYHLCNIPINMHEVICRSANFFRSMIYNKLSLGKSNSREMLLRFRSIGNVFPQQFFSEEKLHERQQRKNGKSSKMKEDKCRKKISFTRAFFLLRQDQTAEMYNARHTMLLLSL